MLNHSPEVFEVQQQESFIVGYFEYDLKHTGLGFVEIEQSAQHQWTHVRYSRPERMAVFAEYIPEGDGVSTGFKGVDADFGEAGHQFLGWDCRHADPGKITFHVGYKDRNSNAGKHLRHLLKGDGFSGAGCPGNESMAIGETGDDSDVEFVGFSDEKGIHHGFRGEDYNGISARRLIPIAEG